MTFERRELLWSDSWLTQVIRILTFIILVPILNSRGYTLNWKECAVLSWSGLRGAVGLALGLQIYGDDEIHSELFRVKQFFHIGCVAMLTILIQGTSMRPFMMVSLCQFLHEKEVRQCNGSAHLESYTLSGLSKVPDDCVMYLPSLND